MTDQSLRPARLITTFGTALYVDAATGELRHGPVETCPMNTVLIGDPNVGGRLRGRLIFDPGHAQEAIVCGPEGCRTASRAKAEVASAAPTLFEVIPLERGLFGLSADGAFLSAIPDGHVSLSARVCSTWELFLASEAWCAQPAVAGSVRSWDGDPTFDRQRIKKYIVHPLIRAKTNQNTIAPKVLIFGYTNWSHGRVYYDLSKHLFDHGYIVDILNWRANHADYIAKLTSYYDFFLTSPDGVRTLVDGYKVHCSRIIVVSHSEFDIRMLIEQKGVAIFEEFANYGVVSESLYSASIFQLVRRIPMVVPLGINYSEFHSDVPNQLETIGYAASMSLMINGVEVKRGFLAEAVAKEAGLAFKVAGSTAKQISFQDMPEFYRGVDVVLVPSTNEGGGLPVMEAAAAGRLVIGTPVGHFPLKASQGGGIIAPIEAEKFTAFATTTLRYYKANPTAYIEKCRSIQKAAQKFDWQHTINEWVSLIDGARNRPREGSEEIVTTFSNIHNTHGFGGAESVSGPGSSFAATVKLRKELPRVLKALGVRQMIDAPCGDLNWMRHLEYDFDLYVGVDVVPSLVEKLRGQLGDKKMKFMIMDICQDVLPCSDAIFCRDCLVHLPFSKIFDSTRLFKKSGAKYLLTTTFPGKSNVDISIGKWRPLDLCAEPFCWPDPLELIEETYPEDPDIWSKNKSIGVWALESL